MRALGSILGVVIVGAFMATPASAQHDPRKVPGDLQDQEVRLWDRYQRAGMTKWFYGRFKTREDGSLWKDDAGQYQFDVDLNHPTQKNSPRTLREAPKNLDAVKFRQLPHQVHWKVFLSRYPEPRKKPDRGAIAALAKEAIALAQGAPKANWDLFLDEIRGGLLDTAARIYEEVLKISPDWPTGYQELGDLYRLRFDYENEMRTYVRARQANAIDDEVLRREAEALERLGLLGDAERVFLEALQRSGGNMRAQLGLGRVRLKLGRVDEALAPFEQAANGGNVNVAGTAAQGVGRVRLKSARTPAEVDEAVKAIEAARDRATDEARGLDGGPLRKEVDHDLAVARLLQGQFAQAQDLLVAVLGIDGPPQPPAPPSDDEEAVDPDAEPVPAGPRLSQEFDPFRARAYTNLGVACMRNENLQSAEECFGLAAAMDPTSGEPWIALGGLREKQGRFYEAAAAYQQALAIAPNDAGGRYALGQLLFRADKLDEAEKELEEAIRYDPNLADALVLLGHVALRTQRDSAAARYFARAAEFLPEDADLHATRGVALLRSNDLVAADAAFNRALQLDGKNLTAQEGQAWIEYARSRGKRDKEDTAVGLMQQIDSPWSKEAQRVVELQRNKQQWTDIFDRVDGNKAGNRWEHDLKNGPAVQLRGQRAVLSGAVKKNPTQPSVQLIRESDRDVLVSLEANLWLDASKPFGAHLVLLATSRKGDVRDAVFFGKNPDGNLVFGHYDGGKKVWVEDQDLGPFPAPRDDGAVRLGIEREMEGKRLLDRYTLWVNGEVLATGVEAAGRLSGEVWVGVQAMANLNVAVDVEVDDVRIVELRSK